MCTHTKSICWLVLFVGWIFLQLSKSKSLLYQDAPFALLWVWQGFTVLIVIYLELILKTKPKTILVPVYVNWYSMTPFFASRSSLTPFSCHLLIVIPVGGSDRCLWLTLLVLLVGRVCTYFLWSFLRWTNLILIRFFLDTWLILLYDLFKHTV